MLFKNRFFTIGILVAVCVLTSVATVFGAFIMDAVSSYGKDKTEVAPASYPHLSENLQNQLNLALSPEFPFDFETAGNPFADKTGVSLAVGDNKSLLPVGNNGQTQLGQIPRTVLPNGSQVMPLQNFNQPTQPTITIKGTNINPFDTVLPVENTVDSKQLLQERNRQIRQGLEVGDLSGIYSINDVRPIGMIGSGDKNRVWLYSPKTKQRFSVRKGTRFRDGTIEGVTKEGVDFRRNDGTVANSRWMKNSELSKDNDADAPLLRVEQSPQNPVQTLQPLPNTLPTPTQTVRVIKSKRKQ
jgi:hypothetical protein